MQATVFIRKGNEKKWLAVHNKSDWINTLLDNSSDTSSYGKTIDTPAGPAITVLSETTAPSRATPHPFVPKSPDPNNGYPCCNLKKPCKHWTYDGDHAQWVNTITGNTKEVQ